MRAWRFALPVLGVIAWLVAQPVFAAPPTLVDLEGLCPGRSVNDAQFGLDDGDTSALGTVPAGLTEFHRREPSYTSWSRQLAAITVRAASPDGSANLRWQEAIASELRAGGWIPLADPALATPLEDGMLFEKTRRDGVDARRLLFEVAIAGARMLRCGDQALLRLDRDEAEGRLATGSARPLELLPESPARLPGSEDCTRPELLAAFAGDNGDGVDDDAPAFVRFSARADQAARASSHAHRLQRWLAWRMLRSGRIDQERLWDIEQEVAPHKIDSIERDFGDLLSGAGVAFKARERNDARGMCEAFVQIIIAQVRAEERNLERHKAISVALEAEAERLSIPLN